VRRNDLGSQVEDISSRNLIGHRNSPQKLVNYANWPGWRNGYSAKIRCL
jgi:hypothetical protein